MTVIVHLLDPVYTRPDSSGHDMKLSTFKINVAFKFIILDNLITTNYGKNGKKKYDRKLTERDVVTIRSRYRVNGALGLVQTLNFSCAEPNVNEQYSASH